MHYNEMSLPKNYILFMFEPCLIMYVGNTSCTHATDFRNEIKGVALKTDM